jgi:hypothetical protein
MISHANNVSIGSSTAASEVLTLPSSLDDFTPAGYGVRATNYGPTGPSSVPDSPAISGFNFHDLPESTSQAEIGPIAEVIQIKSQRATMKEGDRAPKGGDDAQAKISRDASKRRTQHFEDQFAYKDNWESMTADDVRRESPVVLELRTNVGYHISMVFRSS